MAAAHRYGGTLGRRGIRGDPAGAAGRRSPGPGGGSASCGCRPYLQCRRRHPSDVFRGHGELSWACPGARRPPQRRRPCYVWGQRFGRNQVRAANDPAVLALFPANNSEEGREEAALVGMVEALGTLVEARDYSTGRHSPQVADLVLRLTRALGLPPSGAQMIALAGG